MKEKMISVIVPVYNGEKTILRCLKSITEQTLEDIEIIVVDDGSTDNTVKIVKSINDSRIHVPEQENSGQGSARNAGLKRASGEYAAFVDADDTIEREMLEKMYNKAKQTGADIVQCNLTDIFEDGKKRIQLPLFEGVIEPDKGYMAYFMAAKAYHSFEVCNKLFSMEFIRRNKLLFKDTRKYFSEDLLFNMEAARVLKKICFIPEPYYNYYQNESGHMRSGRAERVKKIRSLFQYYENAHPDMKRESRYLCFVVQMWNIGACVEGDREFAKEELKSKFFRECIYSVFHNKSSLRHKIYAALAIIPPTRLWAAKMKYLR